MDNGKNHIIKDIFIIAISILASLIIVQAGLLGSFLESAGETKIFGSFIAGFFFTSVFTTAPAILVLGEVAQHESIFWMAFFGGFGALLGDMLLFRIFRNHLVEDIVFIRNSEKHVFKHVLEMRLFRWRWFTAILGAAIIASPFPDELGIMIMGFSKMKTKAFIPFSYIANFAGILLIGLLANTIA